MAYKTHDLSIHERFQVVDTSHSVNIVYIIHNNMCDKKHIFKHAESFVTFTQYNMMSCLMTSEHSLLDKALDGYSPRAKLFVCSRIARLLAYYYILKS